MMSFAGQFCSWLVRGGVRSGAANREGRHLEVNYELAGRFRRHSQRSLTF